MALCAFIGDEVSAAGFRLAGIDVHVPEPLEAPVLFQRLLEQAQIVLVTAEAAAWLPHEVLCHALSADRPLVLVIPDMRAREPAPDLSAVVRRQLGMVE